jgi:hypothetical protein
MHRGLALFLTGCAATMPSAATLPIEESGGPEPVATSSSARGPARVAELAVTALPALRAAGRLDLDPPSLAFEPTLGPSDEPGPYAIRTTCYTPSEPLLRRDEMCVTALGVYREQDGAWQFVSAVPLETREEIDALAPPGRSPPCGYQTSVTTRWEVYGGPSCIEIRDVHSRMISGSWCEGAEPVGYCGTGMRLRYDGAPAEMPPSSSWFLYGRHMVPDLRGAWELDDTTWRRIDHCEGPLVRLGVRPSLPR